MEAKFDIISRQIIKPSSTTPPHLKDFKLSLLDQLVSYQYVPFLLFYSASDLSAYDTGFASLCDKLKTSLSDLLTIYYPFCGRIKGNGSIDCNDAGVLFIEASVSTRLTTILEYPQVKMLTQLLPIDPHNLEKGCINYEEQVLMAVQASELGCGAVVIGVSILHKIADGIAMASFLNAWAETAKVSNKPIKPYMEASLLFPPKDSIHSHLFAGFVDNKELVTARLVFDGTSLSRLRAEISDYNHTRVESVTALIWKLMMEATLARSKGKNIVRSYATHAVNIRNRMVPPLPEHSIGNFVQLAHTPLVELQVDKSVELHDLAMMVKKAKMRLDIDYVNKLASDAGLDMVMEFGKQVKHMKLEGSLFCPFSSWTKLPLYEVDFGWGKPTWVTTVIFPIGNHVILMATRCGKGIEAWMNLDKLDMVEFEQNPKLLQYASISRASS